jgi:hypothetical protein
MPYINLTSYQVKDTDKIKKKVMVFTEGTILGPRNLLNIYAISKYIPIGNCVNKIRAWEAQGAEIYYFTSRKTRKQIDAFKQILEKYQFAGTRLYYRGKGQKYQDIVEKVVPDILIEDDCRSIGGEWQMCITNVKPEIKKKIISAAVTEFKGIDHLPDLITDFKQET